MLWWPLLPPPQPLLLLLLLLLLVPSRVHNYQLILQAPTSIFEGDRVTLRCLSKKEEDFDKMTYYKDGREVQSTVRNSNFIIPKAVSHNNGIYSCRTLIEDHAFPLERSSNDVRIIVQELFPPPELTARPSKPIEGSPVALRCETRLPSQRSYIQLRFQFLKDNYTLDAGWRTSAKLQIPTMRAEHSGSYACKARAATSDIWRSSQTIQIHVQIPVSHLLFTLRLPRAQAEVGDVVELRCEARRGSPPIWYQFYHEDVFLGGSSAPSGGGASFNLSLTEEHSGKYSCAATNGLRTLHSDTVSLNVTEPSEDTRPRLAAGVTGGLLLGGLMAAALLFCLRFRRKSGSSPDSQEHTYSNLTVLTREQEPVYNDANPVCTDVVYSQVWSISQTQDGAEHSQMPPKIKDHFTLYSEVKKGQPSGGSAEQK